MSNAKAPFKMILGLSLTMALTHSPAHASLSVTCIASCVLDGKNAVVTVQGRGIDQQDALLQLKQNCDIAGANAKSSTHFLATSISKPNAEHTATQTEFDRTKACF